MQNQARVLFHVGLSPHFLLNALGNRFLSPVTLGLGGDICLQCQFAVCRPHFSSTGSSTHSSFGDPAQALTFVLAQWLHPASVLSAGAVDLTLPALEQFQGPVVAHCEADKSSGHLTIQNILPCTFFFLLLLEQIAQIRNRH